MTDSDIRVEAWKPIPGAALYDVSDHGRVRSARTGHVLATRVSNRGYVLVNFTDDEGKKVTRTVHTVVLEAFVGPRPDGMEACHEDDDPLDNRLAKLRWDWPEGNREDRERNRPQRICIRCQRNPVTKGGKRCHECVVTVGVRAAALLSAGVPLGKACAELDYPSPEGLHTLARKYGGYGQQPPAWSQRVTGGVVALRDRLRRRHSA